MRVLGHGQICLWQGGGLWIGRFGAATAEHAHHAVQVTLALEGSFRFQASGDPEALITHRGTIIAPHVPHAFIGENALVAHLFVEPESGAGRILVSMVDEETILQIPPSTCESCISLLRDCYAKTHNRVRLIAAALQAIGMLTSGTAPAKDTDPRVIQAMQLLRERLDERIHESDIAEAVFLSPSRFRHLFVSETGMPFKTYVLWLRIGRAVLEMTKGNSLTTAAHTAGFADQAHMSRTFRRMFGVPPSALRLDN